MGYNSGDTFVALEETIDGRSLNGEIIIIVCLLEVEHRKESMDPIYRTLFRIIENSMETISIGITTEPKINEGIEKGELVFKGNVFDNTLPLTLSIEHAETINEYHAVCKRHNIYVPGHIG